MSRSARWQLLLLLVGAASPAAASRNIALTIDVNVGLLGFSADGAWQFELNAGELHEMLATLLPERQPSCGPDATPLDVTYKLNYNVVLMQTGLARLQRTLATSMRPAGGEAGADVYDVEASAIEEHFDMLYSSYFAQPLNEPPTELPSDAKPIAPHGYTVLVINPNKADMAQLADLPPNFSYRYRYNGGAPSQMWLSGRRYLVFDLSAGPCSLGMAQASEGTVSAASVPQIHAALQGGARGRARREADPAVAAEHDLYHTHFMAQLAAVLLSAVRHVVAADLTACAVADFDELIVPLLVLRNHDQFDPLVAGHPFSLDVPRLTGQLRKLLLPGQTVQLLPSTHDLHSHPQLSVAVARATQSDTVHEPRDGRYQPSAKPYIDAEGLAHQLHHTVDWLALPLLEAATGEVLMRHKASAAAASPPPAPPSAGGGGGGLAAAANAAANAAAAAAEAAAANWRRATRARHRVLPVYLFSLAGLHEEVLLDRAELAHAARDGSLVLALQTEQGALALPYVSEDAAVHISPRDPTRQILAALAAAVGAVPPPYEARLPGAAAPSLDFAWATGHHPFGPFSNASAFSQLTVDAAQRNALLSRLHAAHRTLDDAAAALEAAAAPYVHATDADSPEHRQLLGRLREAALGGGDGGGDGGGARPQWEARLERDTRAALVALGAPSSAAAVAAAAAAVAASATPGGGGGVGGRGAAPLGHGSLLGAAREAEGELERVLLERMRQGTVQLSAAKVQREVVRLYEEALGFDARFDEAATALHDQDWAAAASQTSLLLRLTAAFSERLEGELASLELALGCCETTHAVPASYHLRTVLLLVVGAAIAYGVTVWLATPREAKPLVVGTAIAGGETVWQASHEEARPGVRRR